ncbi:hypothetical protein [Paenibacillus sp. YN15]|uniref:hypothetical protein n=1 Tax=Paenibacillus sp. YN15 TaxID=1742774 RepID=UPI000DCCFBBC|nr:hypothetical protein [Paenibacillus sp. YN15]RAV05041.1 hypothetical protein DQG13_03935 [Paenibacillus sp. YN15]
MAQYCLLKETKPFWDKTDWIYEQVRWSLDGVLTFLGKNGLLDDCAPVVSINPCRVYRVALHLMTCCEPIRSETDIILNGLTIRHQ